MYRGKGESTFVFTMSEPQSTPSEKKKSETARDEWKSTTFWKIDMLAPSNENVVQQVNRSLSRDDISNNPNNPNEDTIEIIGKRIENLNNLIAVNREIEECIFKLQRSDPDRS